MTSFNEWLEQRDERIYNELMEPPVAGADQKTLMDKWTYKNRGGVTRMVKDLVKISRFKDSKGKVTCYLELNTDGYDFLKRKLFSMFEKVDKLGRAVGQHFRNIDSNYGGKLIVKLPSYDFINQENFYKAIYKLATDNNLVVRKSKDYFTVLSKKGISQEASDNFIAGYV